jgi:DNA-directed RNA polymerase specialized sigma24 family protein
VSQPSPTHHPDEVLIAKFREGNEDAAAALFERYFERLVMLARGQLGWRLKGVEGSTDMAQSVLRSFFMQLKADDIRVGPEDSLWPLLVTITLNKVRNRAKFWQRERRDLARQIPLQEGGDPLESGPSPQDAAELRDLVDRLLEPFSPRRRRTIELILAGESVARIVAEVGTTERTVYNTRQAAARILERLITAG